MHDENICHKQTPTQVFSFEYCASYKNTYYERNLRTAACEIVTLWNVFTRKLREILYSISVYICKHP